MGSEMCIRDRREIGLNCYIDLMRRDFDKQIKYAVDKDIRFLLIVGKKELLENSVLLQDRYTKEKIKISINNLEDIYRIVKNRIGNSY